MYLWFHFLLTRSCFFFPYPLYRYSMNTSGSFAEQAAKASLDLVGDERETMTQKKNQLRWDAKKKNFVQGTGVGSDNKKMIRTESGALISASFKSGR